MGERRPFGSWDAATLWAVNGDFPAELAPKAAVAAYLATHPDAVVLFGDPGRRVLQRLAYQVGV